MGLEDWGLAGWEVLLVKGWPGEILKKSQVTEVIYTSCILYLARARREGALQISHDVIHLV